MIVKFWIEDEHDLELKEKMILRLSKMRGIVIHDIASNKLNLFSKRTGKQLTEYTVTFFRKEESK